MMEPFLEVPLTMLLLGLIDATWGFVTCYFRRAVRSKQETAIRPNPANDWFQGFLIALVTMTGPFVIPSGWAFVFLLIVWGAPYSLAHSIWVHRFEWAGQPDGIGMIVTFVFYVVVFRYVAGIGRIGWQHLHSAASR